MCKLQSICRHLTKCQKTISFILHLHSELTSIAIGKLQNSQLVKNKGNLIIWILNQIYSLQYWRMGLIAATKRFNCLHLNSLSRMLNRKDHNYRNDQLCYRVILVSCPKGMVMIAMEKMTITAFYKINLIMGAHQIKSQSPCRELIRTQIVPLAKRKMATGTEMGMDLPKMRKSISAWVE